MNEQTQAEIKEQNDMSDKNTKITRSWFIKQMAQYLIQYEKGELSVFDCLSLIENILEDFDVFED